MKKNTSALATGNPPHIPTVEHILGWDGVGWLSACLEYMMRLCILLPALREETWAYCLLTEVLGFLVGFLFALLSQGLMYPRLP